MLIVDSQVHLWSFRPEGANPWHRKIPQYTAKELLAEMDEAGVDLKGWGEKRDSVWV